MKNKNFKKLISKMDNLKETEQGKIKGGIISLSKKNNSAEGKGTGTNLNCPCPSNIYQCDPKTSQTTPGSSQ